MAVHYIVAALRHPRMTHDSRAGFLLAFSPRQFCNCAINATAFPECVSDVARKTSILMYSNHLASIAIRVDNSSLVNR